jgi:hypothetical protein
MTQTEKSRWKRCQLFVHFVNFRLHHAHIVQISGESYRLKERKKAGHVKASATG